MGTGIVGKVTGLLWWICSKPHTTEISMAHSFREGDGRPDLCSQAY